MQTLSLIPKIYSIKPKVVCSYEEEEEDIHGYVVVENIIIGQHYVVDSEGHGYPRYTCEIRELMFFNEIDQCEAYILGVSKDSYEPDISKPTSALSVSSCNGPGNFPLNELVSKEPLFTTKQKIIELNKY